MIGFVSWKIGLSGLYPFGPVPSEIRNGPPKKLKVSVRGTKTVELEQVDCRIEILEREIYIMKNT